MLKKIYTYRFSTHRLNPKLFRRGTKSINFLSTTLYKQQINNNPIRI